MWQRRKFKLIPGWQNPLSFLPTEAVNNVAMSAFAAIDAITVTSELAASALQSCKPHAQHHRQLMGSRTVHDALIKDL